MADDAQLAGELHALGQRSSRVPPWFWHRAGQITPPGVSQALFGYVGPASNAMSEGLKSIRRVKARASRAPWRRSMPESSHSIESGPV